MRKLDPNTVYITVSTIVRNFEDKVLLVKRRNDPFKGCWALPGGFMNIDETTKQCALRELKEEAGIECALLKLVEISDSIDRDPRGRTIDFVYDTVYSRDNEEVRPGDDAVEAKYFSLNEIVQLKVAFEHRRVIHGYFWDKNRS